MLSLPLLIVLAGLAAYALLRSLDSVVRDSEAFSRAVEIWKRLVIAKSQNPREIKRFQNRVRYFAMRLRDDRERRVVSHETQQIEAMLVALAALHHAEPGLVGAPLIFKTTGDTKLPAGVTANNFPSLDRMTEDERTKFHNLWGLVRDCIEQHGKAGLQWPPPDDVITRFKRWSEGIVT